MVKYRLPKIFDSKNNNQSGSVLPLMVLTITCTILMLGAGTMIGMWLLINEEKRNLTEFASMALLQSLQTNLGNPYQLLGQGVNCASNCGPGLGLSEAQAKIIAYRVMDVRGIANTDGLTYASQSDSSTVTLEYGTCDPNTLQFSGDGGYVDLGGGAGEGEGAGGGFGGMTGLLGAVGPGPAPGGEETGGNEVVPGGTATPTPIPPTATPTVPGPTATPTHTPTGTPTTAPSSTPTVGPSSTPTVAPTSTPTPGPVVTATGLKVTLNLRSGTSIMNSFSGLFGSSHNPIISSVGVGCYLEHTEPLTPPFPSFYRLGHL